MSLNKKAAAQAANIVRVQIQICERLGGRRITGADAGRIFGDAYMMTDTKRAEMRHALEAELASMPAGRGGVSAEIGDEK